MTASGELPLIRRLVAEAGGSAFLMAVLAGSVTLAGRAPAGGELLTLVAVAAGMGALVFGLTLAFGPVSGGYFNPVLTLAAVRELGWRDAACYTGAQIIGAVLGAGVASCLHAAPLVSPGIAPGIEMAPLQLRRVELVAAFAVAALAAACPAPTMARASAAAACIVALVCATGTPYLGNPALLLASASLAPENWASAQLAAVVLCQLGGAVTAAFAMRWVLAPERESAAPSEVIRLQAAAAEHRIDTVRPRLAAAGE